MAKKWNWCPKRHQTGSDTRRVGYRGRERKLIGNNSGNKDWGDRDLLVTRTMVRVAKQAASNTDSGEGLEGLMGVRLVPLEPTEHLRIIPRFGPVIFADQVALAGRFTIFH